MCEKLTLMFPDENGVELEIEYEFDALFPSGLDIQAILMTSSKKPYWFSEFLNASAFELIEKMIISKFDDMKNARFELLAEERRA